MLDQEFMEFSLQEVTEDLDSGVRATAAEHSGSEFSTDMGSPAMTNMIQDGHSVHVPAAHFISSAKARKNLECCSRGQTQE